MEGSFGVVGGMPPSTSSSLPSPPPADTFPVSSPNGNWHLCSRRACSEQCQSHCTRGHGSVCHPSVMWPLEMVGSVDFVYLYLAVFSFGLFTAEPVKIKRSSRT